MDTNYLESVINEAYEIGLLLGIESQDDMSKKIFKDTIRRVASTAIDKCRQESINMLTSLNYELLKNQK